MSGAGRPEKPIDWNKVDKLLEAHCSGAEIASHFDMHPTTFYYRLEEKYGMNLTNYSSEKQQKGNSLLREAQYDKALERDNTMMIWLGKQWLDQKEPQVERSETFQSETLKVAIAEVKELNEADPLFEKSIYVAERGDGEDQPLGRGC